MIKRFFQSPKPSYLRQDDSCHWFLIPEELLDSFEDWVEAMDNCYSWNGTDYNQFRLDGGPQQLAIFSYGTE